MPTVQCYNARPGDFTTATIFHLNREAKMEKHQSIEASKPKNGRDKATMKQPPHRYLHRRLPSLARALLLATAAACLLSGNAAAAEGETPTMTMQGRLQYPDESPFNVTTHITVNHGEYTTYSRGSDGVFSVANVPPGIYLFDVHSQTHHFSQVKCQFKPDADEAEGKPIFSCIEYYYAGAQKQVQSPENLLTITALATYDYFEVKKGFSFASILKNPMILIMVFTVGLMYYMPKMMEGLEPEERERMQKQMEMQQNPTKMLGELFGGMGGAEPADESPSKSKKKIKK